MLLLILQPPALLTVMWLASRRAFPFSGGSNPPCRYCAPTVDDRASMSSIGMDSEASMIDSSAFLAIPRQRVEKQQPKARKPKNSLSLHPTRGLGDEVAPPQDQSNRLRPTSSSPPLRSLSQSITVTERAVDHIRELVVVGLDALVVRS